MAGFTDYLEDKIMKHVFTNTSFTSPTTLYAALYTVAPSDTGGGTEVSTSGTAYARQTMAFRQFLIQNCSQKYYESSVRWARRNG